MCANVETEEDEGYSDHLFDAAIELVKDDKMMTICLEEMKVTSREQEDQY